MKRNWDMSEVSDGKFYHRDDLVAAECGDCEGCSACCQGMGESIVLDPYDIYRFTKHFGCRFEELLKDKIELNMTDGVILPNLKMAGDGQRCLFLNEKGRCQIHPVRPGICRLFPLGRIYEDRGFRYFLQVHECKKKDRGMVRVSDWLDTPNLKKYEKFITEWHYFLLDWQELVKNTKDATEQKQTIMYLLMLFFNKPYDVASDFYPQFYQRLDEAKGLAGLK